MLSAACFIDVCKWMRIPCALQVDPFRCYSIRSMPMALMYLWFIVCSNNVLCFLSVDPGGIFPICWLICRAILVKVHSIKMLIRESKHWVSIVTNSSYVVRFTITSNFCLAVFVAASLLQFGKALELPQILARSHMTDDSINTLTFQCVASTDRHLSCFTFVLPEQKRYK